MTPAPAAAPPARRKLDCLDALRGLAILLVLGYHTWGYRVDPHPAAIGAGLSVFRYGYVGVHMFLVLSGFCLAHSLIQRSGAGREPSLSSYFRARWRRIGPPYYAAMALFLVLPAALYFLARTPHPELADLFTARQLGMHALFVHGLAPDTISAIEPVFWTLSLEFQFYVIFPLLYAIASRAGWPAMVGFAAATSLAWRLAATYAWSDPTAPPAFPQLINGFFLGRWTEFALGMGVAFWYHRGSASARSARLWATASACLAIAAVLLRWHPTAMPDADFALGLAFAALLAAAIHETAPGGSPAARWAFEGRFLVWVGTISYSLYLIHDYFLTQAFHLYYQRMPRRNLAVDVAAAVAVIGGVFAAGYLFHVVVERRFLRSVDKAPRRATKPAATPPPAPARAPEPRAEIAPS